MNLKVERMSGFGEYLIDGYQVNYLFGLNDICEKYITKESIVLELGSNDGVSTKLFAAHAKKVVAVDMVLTQKMKKVLDECENIVFFNTNFCDFFKNHNTENYDLIYIDGSHLYQDVKIDISNAMKNVKYNGVLCGHDYNSSCPGVFEAVNEILNKENIEVYSDSSWLAKSVNLQNKFNTNEVD